MNDRLVKIEDVYRILTGYYHHRTEVQHMGLREALARVPSVSDVVSKAAFEQVAWERDVAIGQLEELGYGLGEKIRRDEDCVSRANLIAEIQEEIARNDDDDEFNEGLRTAAVIADRLPICSRAEWNRGANEEEISIDDLRNNTPKPSMRRIWEGFTLNSDKINRGDRNE